MKKIFKSRLFFFILGAAVFSTVSVLADSLLASNIEYNPTDNTFEVDKVNTALDELYERTKLRRVLVGTISRNVTQDSFDCTRFAGWRNFTIENFAVVVTGLYGNGSVSQSYFTTSDSDFSYDNTTGILFVQNWHGISARTDLRYAANIYLYY